MRRRTQCGDLHQEARVGSESIAASLIPGLKAFFE